ncbi:GL11699 [Drosophila persimilis]|uniref:GL11699 n=1 Tax=Drosophila persimilis TaxID=7234 RepID=B4GD55_DROPE|nr:protein lifeguard 4 [Drosophila persimilis]EDW32550.1 GL11699 [Drosophila persimilis]
MRCNATKLRMKMERKTQEPLNNHERYPHIPLPPPERRGAPTTSQAFDAAVLFKAAPLSESGQIIVRVPTHWYEEVYGEEVKNIHFDDQTIRKGFIRKVYSILLVQLLFTCGTIALFLYHEPTKMFVQKNPVVLIVAAVLNIIVLIMIVCIEGVRRAHPTNLVCLGIFTVTMSLMLGCVSSVMNANLVLIAVGVTAFLVIGLSVYAIQTKVDYTAMGGVLVTFVMCIIIFGLSNMLMPSLTENIVMSSLMAIIACFFLIYDTQQIVGGNHEYQFSPEEYVFAALTLYVDVVRILVYILRILQKFN